MGDHHFTLQVLTGLAANGSSVTNEQRLKALNDDVALARAMLADTGVTTAREDLALEAAFWAQLPGCFSMRPRKAPITSRNFCAMSGLSQFPVWARGGQSLGRCARAVDHERALALLFLAARERPAAIPKAAAARTRGTRSSAARRARASRC